MNQYPRLMSPVHDGVIAYPTDPEGYAGHSTVSPNLELLISIIKYM